jgi:hypothetical protein
MTSHYEYSISIEDFDRLLYETLEHHYMDYVTIPSEKLSVSRYKNPNINTNVKIINDRIIFNNKIQIHNIINILDYLKINLDPYLDIYTIIIKHIIKIIKINSILERIMVPPANKV